MTPHTNQVVPVELTDAEIEGAFKNTNFGTTDYKAILSKGVESVAMQYHNGWTLTQILRKLGLAETGKTTHGQDKLTAKGLAYLKQRAATPQQQGEPVAWHVSYECGATKISTTRTDKVIWTREHFVTESFTEAERFTGPVNDEGDVVAPIKNKRITPLGLPSLTADASFNQGIEAAAKACEKHEWSMAEHNRPELAEQSRQDKMAILKLKRPTDMVTMTRDELRAKLLAVGNAVNDSIEPYSQINDSIVEAIVSRALEGK